jgi:hypothetical protein
MLYTLLHISAYYILYVLYVCMDMYGHVILINTVCPCSVGLRAHIV